MLLHRTDFQRKKIQRGNKIIRKWPKGFFFNRIKKKKKMLPLAKRPLPDVCMFWLKSKNLIGC